MMKHPSVKALLLTAVAAVGLVVMAPSCNAFTSTTTPRSWSSSWRLSRARKREPTLVVKTSDFLTSIASPTTSTSTTRSTFTTSKTQLQLFPAAALSTSVTSRIAVAAALLITTLLFTQKQTLQRCLYPSVKADPTYSEPLPPGSLGCPLLGKPFFLGTKSFGSGSFYRNASKRLNFAPIFKFMFFNRPFAVVAGGKLLKTILNSEFEAAGIATAMSSSARRTDEKKPSFMGTQSLVNEQDKQQHSFLRRLIGQAITPAAVAQSIPTLQAAAETSVQQILGSPTATMETVCTDFTLDVAWKQILGLDLSEEEIPTFHQAVNDWVGGFASLRAILQFKIEKTKGYKARKWIEGKVEEKIQELEQQGTPDSSTLSGMVFAADDETTDGQTRSTGRKLTKQQVIDNCMLLILAGSETSASTLTNAMLFLGLHKHVWDKLKQEQRTMQQLYGNTLTKQVLDNCPYTEAVIKESMRIRPISGGIPRVAKETLVVDNKYQIPKGWIVDWSVPLTHELDPKTFQPDGSHMDIYTGFKPERWLDPATIPEDFIPMGAGPRYCLGANLAYAEMKVFLAVLARNIDDFDLVVDKKKNKIQWKRMSIIPKAANGVPITNVVPAPQYQFNVKETTVSPEKVL